MEKEVVVDKVLDYSIDDESIYSEDVRDLLLEDDELSPFEDAFMRGYEEAMD